MGGRRGKEIFVRRILMSTPRKTLSATNLINHRSTPLARNILLIVFNEHCETNTLTAYYAGKQEQYVI